MYTLADRTFFYGPEIPFWISLLDYRKKDIVTGHRYKVGM